MFRSLGLNIEDFPSTVSASLLSELVDARKLWAAPDTDPAKKAWRPLAAEAHSVFNDFMFMTEAGRDHFNALALDARIKAFKLVFTHIHNSLQISFSGFFLSILYYADNADPVISSKAKTLFTALSRSDFYNYNVKT